MKRGPAGTLGKKLQKPASSLARGKFSENYDIILVTFAIAIVMAHFLVFRPVLVAGTIDTGQVAVSIDSGAAGTTVQGGHSIAVTNVPSSSYGGYAITCYVDNDTSYVGAQTCVACAGSCYSGPYSCTVTGFTLNGCAGSQIVYARCSDAESPANYMTTQNSDTIVCDSSPPTAGAISSPTTNSWDSDGSFNVVWTGGSDAQSGIKNDTLFRSSGTLSAGSCSGYGANSSVSTTPGTTAQSVATGCYQYKVTTCNNANP
ncbi:MAG: hypothetical protein V1820_03690 [archaeon]